MGNKSYDENFYADQRNRSRLSASKIVPFILDSLVPLKIESVVDFGCGVGGWLAEFKSCNSTMEVKGLDFGNANTEQFFIDVNNEFEKRI